MSSQFEYHVDVVLVMDATSSMTPVLSSVKDAALGFHDRLLGVLRLSGKHVDRLRIRIVTFRDLRDNGEEGLAASQFFILPEEESAFASWIGNIGLIGNTTYPESALAGLAVALHSPWTSQGSKRRHVVVLWTDDAPHAPEEESLYVPDAFRGQVAESFDDLTDLWESSQFTTLSSRRLVLFAPAKGLWPEVSQAWDNVVMFPSQAGFGLADYELDQIMSAIANSV